MVAILATLLGCFSRHDISESTAFQYLVVKCVGRGRPRGVGAAESAPVAGEQAGPDLQVARGQNRGPKKSRGLCIMSKSVLLTLYSV